VDESDSEFNKRREARRSRREEWVMVVRDDDEESIEQSQTDMYNTTENEAYDNEKDTTTEGGNMALRTKSDQFSQPGNPKIVIHPENANGRSYTLELEKTLTSASLNDKKKRKKDKKKKKQKKQEEDDDGYVEHSKCCCVIC